jgi:hypothetical protein
MRDNLYSYLGQNISVKGYFTRYGRKRDAEDVCAWNTVLLTNVQFLDDTPACEHLWFICKKDFLKLELRKNAFISVMGDVEEYSRSNNSIDYCIPNPTYVSVLKQGTTITPLKVWESHPYMYFKYVVEGNPRWYRINTISDVIERISYSYNPSLKEFLIGYLKFDEFDTPYMQDLKVRMYKKKGP